jgi:hypothetical protein
MLIHAFLKSSLPPRNHAVPRGFCATVLCDAMETDWLAGHIGFEPANPSASYLIGISWQLRLSRRKLGGGDPLRASCRDADLQLRPRFRQTILVPKSGQHHQSDQGGSSDSNEAVAYIASVRQERLSAKEKGRGAAAFL